MDDVSRLSLNDFALKGMPLAKMTGVSLAMHGIEDGFLLQHVGVGCKYKAAAQVSQHDWGSHPNQREAWTQVAELTLIQGSSNRIGPFARSWYERRQPGIMGVVSAYFIELTGEDVGHEVSLTEDTLPCPMVVIPTAGPHGGFYDGYASTMLEVARTFDWKGTPPRLQDHAAVLGWMFHRYEPDQKADVAALKQLMKVAGVQPGPILFSGVPYQDLAQAPHCGIVLRLPWIEPRRKRTNKLLKGRTVVDLDLPMGLAGTRRFVQTLARATGGREEVAMAWLDKQEAAAAPHLAQVRNHMQGFRVAIFADTPLAAGLASLMRELGVDIAYVGLRDTVLGGEAGFRRVLEADGVQLNDDAVIEEKPALRHLRERVLSAARQRGLHAVIGSSVELTTLQYAGDARSAIAGLPLIEVGFPSREQHAALALPSIGVQGALVWAQRLLDAGFSPKVANEKQGVVGPWRG